MFKQLITIAAFLAGTSAYGMIDLDSITKLETSTKSSVCTVEPLTHDFPSSSLAGVPHADLKFVKCEVSKVESLNIPQ